MLEAHLRESVHVWLTDTNKIHDPSLLERYASWLSPGEKAAHLRFHFEKDRHLYLVAHALVRWVLSQYVAIPPEEWRFIENAYGRPEIAHPETAPQLRFNLSHTKGLVAVATTELHDIGVDVEWKLRDSEIIEIADRYFSAAEVRDLQALPLAKKRDRFFDLWTLKESYIKARGMGLALPLGGFSFSFEDHDAINVTFHSAIEDDPRLWHFRLGHPSSEHQAALAVRSPNASSPSVHWHWVVPGTPLSIAKSDT